MVAPARRLDVDLDRVFGALSHPIRREVLTRLARSGEASVSDLAEPFDVSLMAVSRHVKVLEEAGLVSKRQDGRVQRCSFDGRPMEEIGQWIEEHRRFWEGQLDRVGEYLAATRRPHGREDEE